MLKISTIILLLFVVQLGFSQIDSLRNSAFDSLKSVASLQWVKDSLTINAWSDSLKIKVQNRFKPDSTHLVSKIDSLKSLGVSTEPFSSRLDSLVNGKQSKFDEIYEKQQELSVKTKARVDRWQQSVRARLDSLGIKGKLQGNLQGVNIPGAKELKIPDLDLPEMPSLSPGDFGDLNLSPDLSKLNTALPFVSTDGLKGIQDNLPGASDKILGISDLQKNPVPGIEAAVSKIDGVSEITKQTDVLEELKPPTNPIEQLQGANQEELKGQAAEKAIDHFAGKDEPLNKAMETVSKYKQKFSSAQSLKDIPKKVPNPMKDKPFIERLLPGLAIQIQRMNDYLVDFNPYVGYRFNGRLTSGFGWNHRIAFNVDEREFVKQARIYGPRVFGEFDLWKGFCPRAEIEVMNTWVQPLIQPSDLGSREWVWSYFAGMKKSYSISKRIRGTAMIMFNLYDPHYKSPYSDRVNMRIGFEFPLKKKKKETPTG